MPRLSRLVLDNSSYHIMVRGNQKQRVFLDDEDYSIYVKLLKSCKTRYRFKLYAFCLMPNHVHLIVEADKSRILRKIMQSLNQSYTIWFNKKYGRVGHLWQGRYKSLIIQKNRYMLDVINYVELNPIRSGITKSFFEYPWSSWVGRFGQANYNYSILIDTPELD